MGLITEVKPCETDQGTVLRYRCKDGNGDNLDISEMSVLTIHVKQNDGVIVDLEGAEGDENYEIAATATANLFVKGQGGSMWGYIEDGSGGKWTCEVVPFGIRAEGE